MLNVSKTTICLPKAGHVDMLTLTCNSSLNQHFLPVPHELSPEPELSETNRAENKAPSRTKINRIWPRAEPGGRITPFHGHVIGIWGPH